MCGRLNVIADPLTQIVSEWLGLEFNTTSNADLRPTQLVSAISKVNGQLEQLDAHWGIQPHWAKKIIINAQAETVAEKHAFKSAIAEQRCLIPCSGWYEWRDEGGARKQRYSFSHADSEPLLMAGIWFSNDNPQLVTLTKAANEQCAAYHPRMPVLIGRASATDWMNSDVDELESLLLPVENGMIRIEKEDSSDLTLF